MPLPVPTTLSSEGLPPLTKDLVEVASWSIAILGGLVAAFRALWAARQSRILRREELSWRKAELARKILSELRADSRIQNALQMLDWTGRDYQIASDQWKPVTWDEMVNALRITDIMTFDDKDAFVRDCFDSLFDALEQVEHYLRTGLLEFRDVEFPLEYHVEKLRDFENAVRPFMKQYGYDLALAFVDRFGTPAHSQTASESRA